MKATTQWIIDVMEEWAPSRWAVESDNVGLLIGDRSRPVCRVLTALDLSGDVLREAVQGRFDFVITHHPLISRHVPPINSITADNSLGKKIMTLIGNRIGLFCAHTNLDAAPGGVNDLLFDLLGLEDRENLILTENSDSPTMGLVGNFSQDVTLSELARHVADVLGLNSARFVGNADKHVHKIGLCSGNGSSLIKYALAKKCDVFITGDISYHTALDVLETGMCMIDATHYASEIPIAEAISSRVKKAATDAGIELIVQCSQVNGQVFKTI